jgi:hypothetical protein
LLGIEAGGSIGFGGSMPTVMLLNGWRFFFYSNESNEPPHIHSMKGDKEAKYWLHSDSFDIEEAFGYRLSPADRRFLRQTIFTHFDYIMHEWNSFTGGRL